MSLDYSLSDIKDWGVICLDKTGELKPITKQIIHLSLVVCLGSITEKNVSEWMFRLRFLRAIDRAVIVSYIELGAHIGLRTNMTNDTRTVWLKKVWKSLERDVDQEVKRIMKEVTLG